MNLDFHKNVLLSDYTTIGLGGRAQYFLHCKSLSDINNALQYAKENNLRVQVFAGGSNIIFPDEGLTGLVLKIDLKGIKIRDEDNYVDVKVSAGENWDDIVKMIVDRGLAGIECLSGIPGSVGATPIQNVGAYGQEVKDTIVSLKAIDRNTLEIISFENNECDFEYRQSRFKTKDKDKYIITEVTLRFIKAIEPQIKYSELVNYIASRFNLNSSSDRKEKLNQIRKAVLSLRKKKSMVIDKKDFNSKSCGSFFMNPILDKKDFEKLKLKINSHDKNFPFFKSSNNYKIPAAWLVEQAGFAKGYRMGRVGISDNHSLALINIDGTSNEILALANEIKKKVLGKFGIKLIVEPEVI